MTAWKNQTWVDDDGSLIVGTEFNAARMNNIETGIEERAKALEANGVGYVHHGANAATARPTGFKVVLWEGSVEPTNATTEDIVVYENSTAIHVPAVKVYGVAQSLANGVVTALAFGSERYDNSEMHSTATNTPRLVVPKTGLYLVAGQWGVSPGGAGTGLAYSELRKNGTTVLDSVRVPTDANGVCDVNIQTVVLLEAGEYVEMTGYQTNTGALAKNTSSNNPAPQELAMTWLGSGLRTSATVDWGIVTELPAAAEVGDYCTYKTPQTGVFWRLVKTGEATYPWAKIGGPPMRANAAGGSVSTTGGFSPLEMLAPLAMEVEVDYGVSTAHQTTNIVTEIALTLYVAGVSTGLNTTLVSPSVFVGGPMRGQAKIALTKSQAVRLWWSVNNGGVFSVNEAFVLIDPIRVG